MDTVNKLEFLHRLIGHSESIINYELHGNRH
jgi:hypothetical protein